ncbi:hypothetical protein [Cysteiniphilum sp. JM-1]|uniref:hypothetical protein n=1 Tax=Cysteiniphilum sp. JM-1 TaxID=2610891 RepID=UPI00124806C3|nr:hypothetical protein [Cysteiniphilum sp. JM-1]
MQKLVFKTTEDEKNFETARKLLKRTLKLFKANGGIGVAQDQNNNILSYDFVINMGSDPINFGTCLTTYELVAKTKLYHELVTDSVENKTDLYQNCVLKATSNPSFRPLLFDLQIMAEKIKYIHDSEINAMPSKKLH